MATTVNISTSYAGQDSKLWVKAALLSGNTLANGGMTIIPNINYKTTMHKLSTDALLKNATCDFTALSEVSLTERSLTLENFQKFAQALKKITLFLFLAQMRNAITGYGNVHSQFRKVGILSV